MSKMPQTGDDSIFAASGTSLLLLLLVVLQAFHA